MTSRDRAGALIASTTLNGIDFVEVASTDEKTLRVHFLNAVPLTGTLGRITITGGETVPEVPVLPVSEPADWDSDIDGNPVLTLQVPIPGDFSIYTLHIESPRLDAFFDHAAFSFKALCPSPLDCRTPAPVCPPLARDLPPIDYQAKDFLSFRKALSDFSNLRYPAWKERSEADLGMALLELLCAGADDLSYYQDRVQIESTLDSATQRRSLVRLARLVDYEPQPALAARVLLHFDVTAAGPIAPGVLVSAAYPDGDAIPFETGTGLADTNQYPCDPAWNNIAPYWLDDSQRCLQAGSTSMYVAGHGLNLQPGQQLLIETDGPTSADPAVRQLVHLLDQHQAVETIDPLFGSAPITQIFWQPQDALAVARDLTQSRLKSNLVPATQGRRYSESFAIVQPPASSPQMPLAVCRQGPDESPVYQFTLRQDPLAWLAPLSGSGRPQPEIGVTEQSASPVRNWTWFRWLLDAAAFDPGFTVDRAKYSPVALLPGQGGVYDYDGDGGDSIRFGDGVFGDIPNDGATFEVTYRAGGGLSGNVAADSSWRIETPLPATGVTNPFAATGGADAETPLAIRRNTPQAFRAQQFRAVLPHDYEDAARRLDWVERAGTVFRWTGSWLTVFTTPDPKGSLQVALDDRENLVELLNRYRMAGYESYVPDPRYAPIDLVVNLCARADSFRGDVHAAVPAALSMTRNPDGSTGFFHPDNFTFGQPLERSALEAAIQSAPGVGGVIEIYYRRRGAIPSFVVMPSVVTVGSNEIVVMENDPSRPERGSVRIYVEGGK